MLDKFLYAFFGSLDTVCEIMEGTMKKIWDEVKHYWSDHKKVALAVGVILIIAIIA